MNPRMICRACGGPLRVGVRACESCGTEPDGGHATGLEDDSFPADATTRSGSAPVGSRLLLAAAGIVVVVIVIAFASSRSDDSTSRAAVPSAPVLDGSTTAAEPSSLASATVTTERGYVYDFQLLSLDAIEHPSDPGYSLVGFTGSARLTNRSGQASVLSAFQIRLLYDVSSLQFPGGMGPFSRLLLDNDAQTCGANTGNGTETIGDKTYCFAEVVLRATRQPIPDGESVVLQIASDLSYFTVRRTELPVALVFLSSPGFIQGVVEEGGAGNSNQVSEPGRFDGQ